MIASQHTALVCLGAHNFLESTRQIVALSKAKAQVKITARYSHTLPVHVLNPSHTTAFEVVIPPGR